MLRPRIIPCLLIKSGGLVKTEKFANPKYVGDPINAVKIFNEKEVDELIVLDIDATVHNNEPDYDKIKNLATECRMPLCYGGGVKTVEHAEKIISMGVEKVAISSAAVEDSRLVANTSKAVGSQSVVVVMDVKKNILTGDYEIWTHNGRKPTGKHPAVFALELESLGAGEIVVNSIDNDGVMKGYDIALVEIVREAITLPITALGGAGSLNDIASLIDAFKIIGAGAGSLFVFKGVYRAVLISYPNRVDKDAILDSHANKAV
jgi:imidazole glycerol-phosphate synthase subunit HisF